MLLVYISFSLLPAHPSKTDWAKSRLLADCGADARWPGAILVSVSDKEPISVIALVSLF